MAQANTCMAAGAQNRCQYRLGGAATGTGRGDSGQKGVGYAGLKDRHAVTTQWFSLQLPGRSDPDFHALPADIEILEQQRRSRKLKRGALNANHFRLTLRKVAGDREQAATICQMISQHVPNYYGSQRFGHNRQPVTG
ncbi:MAG: tRNA pseudouridine(13) synthase TruD [Thiolinea sp.]